MAYGIGAQSGAYISDAPVRNLAVPNAVSEIDSEIGRLDILVSDLFPRIAPLLSPGPGGSDQSKCAPSVCEFASQLQGRAASIRAVNDRLQAILSSLEI